MCVYMCVCVGVCVCVSVVCVCVCWGGGERGGGFRLVVEDHKKSHLSGVKRHINEVSGSITGDTRHKDPLASFVCQNH